MISCIEKSCHWTASTHDLLYWHLRRMHAGLIVYKCNFDSCDRTFSARAMFRRHFNKHFITHCILDSNREIEQITQEREWHQAIVGKNNISEEISQNSDILEESISLHKNIKEEQPQTIDTDILCKRIKAM